jgi:hypothetical protein
MRRQDLIKLVVAVFGAMVAYRWPVAIVKDAICDGMTDFEFEACQLYTKCVKPLEISYKFSDFKSMGGKSPLSKMHFRTSPNNKPLILLVGPVSSGKIAFAVIMQSLSHFAFVESYFFKFIL